MNTQFIAQATIVFIGTLIFAACSTVTPTTSSSMNEQIPASLNKEGASKKFGESSYIAPPPGMSMEKASEMFGEVLREPILRDKFTKQNEIFAHQMQNASQWQQVDKAVQTYLDGINTFPMVIKSQEQQRLSQSILQSYLLDEQPTPGVQKTIELYVNLILQNKSYGGTEVLAKSLMMLRGYWTVEQCKQTAQQIVNGFNDRCNPYSAFTTSQLLDKSVGFEKANKPQEYASLSTEQATRQIKTTYADFIASYPIKKLSEFPVKNSSRPESIFSAKPIRWLTIIALLAEGQEQNQQK